MLGPLIIIHEAGHFIVAKLSGIHIEEFGIGFPPRLFTLFERGGTRYTINAIPMGGFVRPAGENDPTIEGGLASASKRARFAVLAAGAAANVVAAYLILVVTFMLGWQEALPGASIEEVMPGSPADSAGLQPGDIVVMAENTFIEDYTLLIDFIHDNIGESLTLQVERGDQVLDVTLTPRANPPEGEGPTGILIGVPSTFRPYGFFEALASAAEELIGSILLFFQLPAIIIRENIPMRFLRPVSVVGISQLGGQAIEQSLYIGQWFPILRLTSFISLALGLTNILPLPALDGGRIMFILIEAIRGKRVAPEREGMVHFVGMAVLLTLMLVFVYFDITDPLVVP